MLYAPIPRLTARLELDRLNVGATHYEMAALVSHGEDGHLFLLQSSSSSRRTASHARFFILIQSGDHARGIVPGAPAVPFGGVRRKARKVAKKRGPTCITMLTAQFMENARHLAQRSRACSSARNVEVENQFLTL